VPGHSGARIWQHGRFATVAIRMQLPTLILSGFSIIAALILLAALTTVYRDMELGPLARASGALLMLGLAALQWLHASYLLGETGLIASPGYRILLFVVAPAFFLFFRGALRPRARANPAWLLLYAPALFAAWLPAGIAIPLAFALGAAFALLLIHLVLALRSQRKRFHFEAMVFALHGVLALAVLALGLTLPWLGTLAYVHGYACLIGLGIALMLYALLHSPDLAANTAEAVRSAYANSSLKSVDVEATVARLQRLMADEKMYEDEGLSLARLAQALEVGPHQLSELINTRFGVGFSRYVRQHRVEAAKRMLLAEPGASVLSIGLAVGFTSQSNFYAAFREITGEVPGRFRRTKSA
jgi:AraC-like DNA-binding protein